jgi:CHC2 zinc finger
MSGLDFMELWGRWPDVPAHIRCVAFGSLPQRDQDSCWQALAAECAERTEFERAERHLDPPKRRSPDHGTPTSTSTGTGRVQFDHSDPLKRIPASEYVTAFTGVPVPASGKICCPLHDDRTPSFKAYGSRWHCFGCGGDGDIYDLASALTGLECRGADFIELRRRVAAALLGGWLHG